MSLPAKTVAMRSPFWFCATNTHRKHRDSVCVCDRHNQKWAELCFVLAQIKAQRNERQFEPTSKDGMATERVTRQLAVSAPRGRPLSASDNMKGST